MPSDKIKACAVCIEARRGGRRGYGGAAAARRGATGDLLHAAVSHTSLRYSRHDKDKKKKKAVGSY